MSTQRAKTEIPDEQYPTTEGSIKSPSAATEPPFLLWPVARREYYLRLSLAAAAPLLWGFTIFGYHGLGTAIFFIGGSLLTYAALTRVRHLNTARFKFHQNLACTMVAAGLLCPLVSITWAMVGGIATALLSWVAALPKRQYIQAGLLAPLLLMLILPLPKQWPLLTRDHLWFGDIYKAQKAQIYSWPASSPGPGLDAVLLNPPDRALHILLAKIASDPGSQDSQEALNDAFALDLPSAVDQIFGGTPGRLGTVALWIIVLCGLYLSYRHILFPLAWVLFLSAVLVGLLFGPLGPRSLEYQFWQSLGGVWYLPPDYAVTLLLYELRSSDFIFASVFVLALPGTMPLEPAARGIFLAVAGIGATLIYRLDLPFPPATAALLLLQPVAPLFDMLFHRRSWLLR
ncbi:MAG TPA: RnfABCDGE type electron transport complex subunit D [Phycisphaerae bacterium]|nr:RnfABCDGE type electron transport complex subunit D [Phycisphaerae bacterium]